MVVRRTCSHRTENGRSCGASPLRDGDFCLWHDPERSEEVAEARRLGGQRRRRERVVAGAFEFNGLTSIPDLRRIIEIAVVDVLGLENSVARARALASLVATATKLLETGESGKSSKWFTAEPVTQSDYDPLLAEARAQLLPLDEAAALLIDDEPDLDELDDEGCELRLEEIAARLRQLVEDVLPERGIDFAVFPDDAAAEVEKLRRHRQKLRAILDDSPRWPLAETFEPPDDDEKRTPAMLAEGLPQAIADELTQTWSELLAIEQVVAEVSQRFAGEEPIHPDARELVDEVKAVLLRLREDVKPDFEVILPSEPDADVAAWLRSLITEEGA